MTTAARSITALAELASGYKAKGLGAGAFRQQQVVQPSGLKITGLLTLRALNDVSGDVEIAGKAYTFQGGFNGNTDWLTVFKNSGGGWGGLIGITGTVGLDGSNVNGRVLIRLGQHTNIGYGHLYGVVWEKQQTSMYGGATATSPQGNIIDAITAGNTVPGSTASVNPGECPPGYERVLVGQHTWTCRPIATSTFGPSVYRGVSGAPPHDGLGIPGPYGNVPTEMLPSGKYEISGTGVAFRQAAGLQGAQIGTFNADTSHGNIVVGEPEQVDFNGEVANADGLSWAKVSAQGKVGFVAIKYMAPVDWTAQQGKTVPQGTPAPTGPVTKDIEKVSTTTTVASFFSDYGPWVIGGAAVLGVGIVAAAALGSKKGRRRVAAHRRLRRIRRHRRARR